MIPSAPPCSSTESRCSSNDARSRAFSTGLWATFLILAVLGWSVIGCSSSPPAEPSSEAQATSAPTAGPQPTVRVPQASPTPAQTEITLNVWVPPEFALGEEALSKQILADFEASHPGLQVNVSAKATWGTGGMLDLLTGASQVAPTLVPDLILMTDGELIKAARAGLVQPMQSLAPQDAMAEVFANLAAVGVADKERYGIPFALDFIELAWRTTITTTTPITWGVVSQTGGRYAFASGISDGYYADAILSQYLGAGGKLTDENGKVSLDARVLAQALDVYTQMSDQGVPGPGLLDFASPDDVWSAYAEGSADFAEVWASRLLSAGGALQATAVSSVPTLKGTSAVLSHGWVWAVTAGTPGQQAAAQFLEWVLAAPQEATWCAAARRLPASKASWLQSSTQGRYMQFLFAQAQTAVPLPPELQSAEASGLFHSALADVLAGRASADQAAQKANADLRIMLR